MSGEECETHHNRTVENDRKRHYSSDTDSNDTPATAQHDGTPPFDTEWHDGTPPFDTATLHDKVISSSEGAVTKHTKTALVKKLKDSTKQQQMEQSLLPEVAPSAAGQPKVSKQEHVVSPLVARGHHKSSLQPARPSLLEDVLNEKKLALLQSPEVRVFLEHAQRSVAEEKRRDNTPEGATHPGPLEERVAAQADDDNESWQREVYACDSEARVWTNASTTNVAGADIWSKEASAFTSVVRPTQQ